MLHAKRLMIFVLLLYVPNVLSQEIPSLPDDMPEIIIPDLIETPDTSWLEEDVVPHTEMYNYLSTAVAEVNSLPDDLSKNNGTDLIQNESATQMMGYAKWMFSATSANELLGATLAPIGINLYLLLTLIVFLTIAYMTVRVMVLIFRFIKYLVDWVLKAVPFF